MRKIDGAKAFELLAAWMAETTKEAQGLVVSLSGTDSALAYCIAAKANEMNGKAKECLVGIHYGSDYPFQAWFEAFGRVEVAVLTENPFLTDNDVYRWAAIQCYALEHRFWIVGTRNRMERLQYDYSLASTVALIQPLLGLWKGEVLALCKHLKMPDELVKSGWEGDPHCECHRPQILRQLPACELALSARVGELTEEDARQADPRFDGAFDLLNRASKGKAEKRVVRFPPDNLLNAALAPQELTSDETYREPPCS